MPEIKNYIVRQEREVKVTANSPLEAILIAESAFANGQNAVGGVLDGPENVWGNTTSHIKTTELCARVDY